MATEVSKNKDFLGKGLSFPPAFDKSIGDIQLVAGEEDVRQSLEIILSTRPLERVLEPDFGCNLDRLLFEPANLSVLTLMEETIERALYSHEPRIKVNDIQLRRNRTDEGIVLIEVDYTVRSTNSRFNFVYPFYITEGTDINRNQ